MHSKMKKRQVQSICWIVNSSFGLSIQKNTISLRGLSNRSLSSFRLKRRQKVRRSSHDHCAMDVDRQTSKTLDYEGWYLTGDYSTTPPSVKLTKDASGNSYWKLPKTGTIGPFINQNELGKEAFLAIGKEPIYYVSKVANEDLKYRRLELSFKEDGTFRLRYFDPKDGGK